MNDSTETMELSPTSSPTNTRAQQEPHYPLTTFSRMQSSDSLESSNHMPSLALFRGDSFTARPQTPTDLIMDVQDVVDYPNPFLLRSRNNSQEGHPFSPSQPEGKMLNSTTPRNKENHDPSTPQKILFACSQEETLSVEEDVTVTLSPIPSSPNPTLSAPPTSCHKSLLMSAGRKRNSSELLDHTGQSDRFTLPESVTIPCFNSHGIKSSKSIHPSSATTPHTKHDAAFRTYRNQRMGALESTASFDSMDSSSLSHYSNSGGGGQPHLPSDGLNNSTSLFGEDNINLGFPARHGQYAFTGSPIDELAQMGGGRKNHSDTAVSAPDYDLEEEGHKVRRLNLDCNMEDGGSVTDDSGGTDSVKSHRSHRGQSTKHPPHQPRTQDMKSSISFFSPPEPGNFSSQHHRKEEQDISPKDVADKRVFSSSTPSPLSANFDPEPSFQSPPITQRKGLHGSAIRPPPSPRRVRQESSYHSSYMLSPKTPRIPHKSHRRHRITGNTSSSSTPSSQDGNPSNQQLPRSRFADDFEILGTLGTGSFGTVYKCLSKLDGCTYAIKAARRQARGPLEKKRMLNEVFALAALSDVAEPSGFHIVRYHQAWMEENRLYIQTELCTSTLLHEIRIGMFRRDRNDAEDVMKRNYKLLRELLLALDLIHKHGLIHLDIKPENIFIKGGQYKLGDFGLVCKSSVQGDIDEGDSKYMCKDLLSGKHEDLTKCDIFSLGISMYEIATGKNLPTEGQEWQDIRAGIFEEMPNAPLELQLIIKSMMSPDPEQRPSAAQLLQRRQLLSEDEKELIRERNKVKMANVALAHHTEQLRRLSPPKGLLVRSNTCPR